MREFGFFRGLDKFIRPSFPMCNNNTNLFRVQQRIMHQYQTGAFIVISEQNNLNLYLLRVISSITD